MNEPTGGIRPDTKVLLHGKDVGAIAYSFTYTPKLIIAKFHGMEAKCGSCSRKLGEFLKVDGEIKCKKCGAVNIVFKK